MSALPLGSYEVVFYAKSGKRSPGRQSDVDVSVVLGIVPEAGETAIATCLSLPEKPMFTRTRLGEWKAVPGL